MTPRFVTLSLLALCSIFNIEPSIGQTANERPAAIRPTSRVDQQWWADRHAEKLTEAKERGDEVGLLFIGDSITHSWDKGLWAERFAKY